MKLITEVNTACIKKNTSPYMAMQRLQLNVLF